MWQLGGGNNHREKENANILKLSYKGALQAGSHPPYSYARGLGETVASALPDKLLPSCLFPPTLPAHPPPPPLIRPAGHWIRTPLRELGRIKSK